MNYLKCESKSYVTFQFFFTFIFKVAKNSSLAVEALAGLASKEDFTAVALKKASGSVGAMLPYKDLMLLHIKGRRHVQTRLVEPVAASINRGDNYVLVTPTEVPALAVNPVT